MKHKSNFFDNLFFLIKNWFAKDRMGAMVVFIAAIIAVLIPMVEALITKTLADSLVDGLYMREFLYKLMAIFALYLLLKFISVWAEERTWYFQTKVSMLYGLDLMGAVMAKDLEDFEGADQRALFERAKAFAFDGDQADGAWSAIRFSKLLTSFLGFLTYSVIFSSLSPLLISILILTSALGYYIQDRLIKFGDTTADQMSLEEMRLYYLYRIAGDESAQKEARLNKILALIFAYLDKFSQSYYKILRKYTRKANATSGIEAGLGFVRDLATYIILTKTAMAGEISVGDFVFYLTLAMGFSEWLNNFTGHILSLKRISLACGKYRDFTHETQDIDTRPPIEKIESIELKDLSFAYKEGGQILKDINLSLKMGDSLAIVGENGAGKTTLVKVLSGLYRPTAGNLYVNGKDMDTYSTESVYERMSILFQDYFLLPGSLIDNIDNKNRDKEKVSALIDQLGLAKRINNLEDGLDSQVIDLENNKITGFSGGEMQRILLAKSLAKDGDILILDEPTAALDPISEENLYKDYEKISKDKISIFISHRINSTRFCDRIIYMEDGQIVEAGSHQELMAKGGKYKTMYDLQASYYKEDDHEN